MAFSGRGRGRRPSDLLKGQVHINYKNVELLERFLEDGSRIRSRRRTRTSAKDQRKLTQAIKRARHIALLPYTSEQVQSSRKEGRRDRRRDSDRHDRPPRRDDRPPRRDEHPSAPPSDSGSDAEQSSASSEGAPAES